MAELEVGELAHITLKLDLDSRELPVPDSLRQALVQDQKAKEAWEALTPSRRRAILSNLNFLKTPEALERNIQKTLPDYIGHTMRVSVLATPSNDRIFPRLSPRAS